MVYLPLQLRAQALVIQARFLRSDLRVDRSSEALTRCYGPRVAHLLGTLPGGSLARETSLWRSWARGDSINHQQLLAAINPFCTADPALLALELTEDSAAAGVRSFYSNPEDDLFLRQTLFDYFVESTFGGEGLDIRSLSLTVFAAPGIRLEGLKNLYDLVGSPDVALYLFEREILYLVRKNARHDEMRTLIQKGMDQNLITEIDPLSLQPSLDSKRVPTPLPVPWEGTSDVGPLDLRTVRPEIDKRWLRGESALDLTSLEPYPSLQEWLSAHQAWVHWSDLQKILKLVDALWHHTLRNDLTQGDQETVQNQLQGILGEILLREEPLRVFRELAGGEPSLVLLVEGEIATADGRKVSDALIGQLNPDGRSFEILWAYEMTTGGSVRERTERQQERTLDTRLPDKGMILLAESGEWGRLSVRTEAAERNVLVLSGGEAERLRREVARMMEEILTLLILRRSACYQIPFEERRLYQKRPDSSRAGMLVAQMVDQLWNDLDQRREATGHYDLEEMVQQIEARIPHFPEAGRPLLRGYLAILQGVASDLNLSGQRRGAAALAGVLGGISDATLSRYQATIEERLRQRGLGIVPNPWRQITTARVAGIEIADAIDAIWERPTAQAAAMALQTLIDSETDPERGRLLRGYALALWNVSSDLNSAGERVEVVTLTRAAQSQSSALGSYHRDVETRLRERGWGLVKDPLEGQRKMVSAGLRAMPVIREALTRKTAAEIAGALRAAIQVDEEAEIRRHLEVQLAILQNVSADLNAARKRKPTNMLARELGVSAPMVKRHQNEIERELKAKGLPVLSDPEAGFTKKVLAGQGVIARINQLWKMDSLQEVELALEAAATAEPDIQKALFLRHYLAALRNMARDLNPAGSRVSVAGLARRDTLDASIIIRYQRHISRYLEQKGWEELPKPV